MEDSLLNKYLDEIGRERLLSEEEEARLSSRILKGDERALNKLIEANLRFVVVIARQYQGRGLSMEDLVSEGNLGLMKAARKFDATRGLRFVNYAVVFIRQQIEKALKMESAEQRVESGRNGQTRSVDAPLGYKPNVSLLSVLVDANSPQADERVYNSNVEAAVEYALRSLNERESQVVNAFFGIGQDHLTMAEIAEDMGLKRERVRQIRNRAIRRMKKTFRRFFLFILILLSVHLTGKAQSPKHEVRAVWLTTIGGIDWPHSFQAESQKNELIRILDQLKQAGINTVLLQTRVRATTIYPSAMEPWDGCITGTPGMQASYDPLQLCIDECHKRSMECHAWVVTIPVGKWNKLGCKQLRQKYPKLIKRIGEDGYMDPEQPQTGDYLAKVCKEIVSRYDVDGIHLDYIRYPETWKIKVSRSKGRDYITDIVRKISRAVKQEKPWVKLSCSPIGKYDDLLRYRAGGWNARTAVCQDAQAWLREGLMDALFPMMYFKDNQFFPFAIDWQEQSAGRMVAPGLGIYLLDPSEGRWTLDQVQRQMNVSRQLGMGHCYFRSKFLTDNIKGIYDFACRFDQTPALVPPMRWAGQRQPSEPTMLSLKDNTLSWQAAIDSSNAPYLLYNIYASEDFPVDITKAENLVATRLTKTSVLVPVSGKNYAVTAMNRYGQESRPAQLLLNAGSRYTKAIVSKTDGRPIALPQKGFALDAEFVAIETFEGRQIAVRPYSTLLDVTGLPDGFYQLRSLGRKGRNHRIGFFSIKRTSGL